MRIYEDLHLLQRRIEVVQNGVVVAFILLLVQFWFLQVIRGGYYQSQAEMNRVRAVPIAAPRGRLLDRSGATLVENRPSFNIVFTPEHTDDVDRSVATLAQLLRMGEAQIRERVARRTPLRPVVIKTDASLEDVAAIEARRLELPEARVDAVPLRSYPLAAASAHALGRVGEITERQLQAAEFVDLKAGDLVGQAGIEQGYNRSLMGQDGARRIVVNSRGMEVNEAEDRQQPAPGPNLGLTLDAGLQKTAEQALAGRAGAVIALDPRNGDILAMTSTPAYDPNTFTTGIDISLWRKLNDDPQKPLLNRVIQAIYAPGSTFKIVTALAALEERLITPQTSFFCPGYVIMYNRMFRCHKGSGHGWVDLKRALTGSCNAYFYNVGVRLEIERIHKYATLMGLGAPSGVDLPGESSGLVPSQLWKLRTQKAPWYPGETVSVSIGQGQVSVTPIQLARLAALVGNGGKLVAPHLVRVERGDVKRWPEPRDLGLHKESIAAVIEGMRGVVSTGGTGWRSIIKGIDIAGKTGSSQVVGHDRLVRSGEAHAMLPHGWFVAFAPVDNPRIAVAALVEHGGSGGEAAAPVVRQVLMKFFGVSDVAPGIIGPIDVEADEIADVR